MTSVRIVPLGGLGEVGMNCLAIESSGGIVLVDCGVTFPHDELGVDLIHPDFSWLLERRDDLRGIVITHGHEDHIGALPFLLRHVTLPVWAPAYAAALIRHRVAEFDDVPDFPLHVTSPRRSFRVGGLSVEPLRVTHSIPDSTALAIDTPAGRLVHTGDFKLESDPLDGELSDETRLRELGDDGVALLLSDSTNVDVPGRAGLERDVASELESVVAGCEGRVVVGIFASNLYRFQSLATIARRTQRRLCLLGRSVQTHAREAQALALLRLPSDLLVSPEQAMTLPAHRLLVVATGTQAESVAALPRLARDEHPTVRLSRGDTVILSARVIPGNDRAVLDVICAFERRGIAVHFPSTNPRLHVSGHAAQDEQRRMLDCVRPRGFVPIHGTYHHLARHASLARDAAVDDVVVIENGQTARLDRGGLTRDEDVPVGRVYVDHGRELPDDVMRDRATMAASGAVFVSVPFDRVSLRAGPVGIETRGLVSDEHGVALRDTVTAAIDDALASARGAADRLEEDAAVEAIRRSVGRVFKSGRRRPLVIAELRAFGRRA